MCNNQEPERQPIQFYLDQIYPITLYPDPEGGYVVELKDLPGCMSQGDTINEAIDLIDDARKLFLSTAYENGDNIPAPSKL